VDLALTLPVFLTYQLGVVFLDVRNATDVVTARLLEASHGDRTTYLAITAAIGFGMTTIFAVLGRGQALRLSRVAQIVVEGAAYAIAMGSATSWVVGKLFASTRAGLGAADPFTGLVMSLGAGFYEELAFRVVLFGLGAKLMVWLFARQKVALVGGAPPLRFKAVLIVLAWALICAAVFSGMHYVGPLGGPFDPRTFAARTVLGLALTLVYWARGFAAAVWTHALYDVWVLVM
jgi:hypothetical protein